MFNTNTAQTFILVLTNLNTILVEEDRENKLVNYPTYSKRSDEDIDDFIIEQKKLDNKKYIVVVNYLKGTAANFYNGLVGITG